MVRTTTARLVALPPYRGGPGEVALDRDRVVIGRDPVACDLVLAGILERQADELRGAYAPWCSLDIEDREDGWILLGGRRR